MNSCVELPQGYTEILRIDLQKDKRLALLVNLIALGIFLVMLAAAALCVPLDTFFDDPFSMVLKLGVLCVGMIVYVILHEAVHGVVMRRFCQAKVNFGFSGMYAYAGSEGYYCRRHYLIIALAPIVVWGVVLGIVNLLVPAAWFYVVYLLQVMNISGAAGDLYVSLKMRKLPEDILVRDTGVSMTVFGRRSEEAAPMEE